LIRNFLIALPLLLLPLIGIEVTTYMTSYSVTENSIAENAKNSLIRVRDVMENVFTVGNRIAAKLSLEDHVRLFMVSPWFVDLYNGNLYKDILKSINMYMDVNSYIDSVYIYSESNPSVINNQTGSTTGEEEEKEWYRAFKQTNGMVSPVVPRVRSSNFPYIISVVRPVSLNRIDPIGAIVVNMDSSRLNKQIGQVSTTAENLFVIGTDGSIIYNNDLSLTAVSMENVPLLSGISLYGDYFQTKISVEGKESIVTGILAESEARWYVSVVPMETFRQRFEMMKHLYILLILLGVGGSIVIAFFISYRAFSPINTIISIIEHGEELQQVKRLKLKSNEVRYIIDSIVKIVYSNKVFAKELEQRLTLLNKAQAVALQSQITPHFLFNTLENINMKAIRHGGENNTVSSMLSHLSEMLRIVMDAQTQLIPISEEVAHARHYVEIMKARYQDKIEVNWSLHPELYDYMITKISIQPLIENAIQHGLRARRRKGTIDVSGRLEEDGIAIVVADNGAGMSAAEVEQLNERIAGGYLFDKEHIGLGNVNQRIRLIFGSHFGIKIESGIDKGTSVSLYIPKYSCIR
jgi:two-component system sensor histidine kinase YesM